MKIKELILKSKNFREQEKFYSQVLKLTVISKSDHHLSYKTGNSILTFKKSDQFTPYHFAINTSSHSENEMLEYVKSRTQVLKYEGEEIIHFPNWNANSVYFYDEDKNIVEFISRNNLKYKNQKEFESDSLFEISEIGLATSDVKEVYTFLNKNFGLVKYDGDKNLERFCAIGDEHGLFICINKDLKNWIPNNDKAYPSDFSVKIEHNGKEFNLEYGNQLIIIN